jgi:divalent metal cation (Fe/Co/Zn/Cd) transporter
LFPVELGIACVAKPTQENATNQENATKMLQADDLRRTALVLVSVGLAWNLVEVVVSFWAGARVGSVALIAFGLDSVVEVFAGGVLVWRLRKEQDGDEDEAAERRAQRLIGLTFFVLAAFVGVHSAASLAGWLPEPQPSLIGVGIAVASALVMSVLYVAKMRVATRMQSRSLRAEALESLFCDLQDLAILVGLGFNALLSWWWADPVAALLLIPFFIKEGRENFSGHDDEDEHEAARVCFCLNCWYGLSTCRAACCRA